MHVILLLKLLMSVIYDFTCSLSIEGWLRFYMNSRCYVENVKIEYINAVLSMWKIHTPILPYFVYKEVSDIEILTMSNQTTSIEFSKHKKIKNHSCTNRLIKGMKNPSLHTPLMKFFLSTICFSSGKIIQIYLFSTFFIHHINSLFSLSLYILLNWICQRLSTQFPQFSFFAFFVFSLI